MVGSCDGEGRGGKVEGVVGNATSIECDIRAGRRAGVGMYDGVHVRRMCSKGGHWDVTEVLVRCR